MSHSTADLQDAPNGSRGRLLLEVANAVGHVHKHRLGRGPTTARAHMVGDSTLVCILDGGLTPAERTLLGTGAHDQVSSARMRMLQAIKPELVAAVESASGRRVTSFVCGCDPAADREVQVFELDRRG